MLTRNRAGLCLAMSAKRVEARTMLPRIADLIEQSILNRLVTNTLRAIFYRVTS
jgi:hypothetical protein